MFDVVVKLLLGLQDGQEVPESMRMLYQIEEPGRLELIVLPLFGP